MATQGLAKILKPRAQDAAFSQSKSENVRKVNSQENTTEVPLAQERRHKGRGSQQKVHILSGISRTRNSHSILPVTPALLWLYC